MEQTPDHWVSIDFLGSPVELEQSTRTGAVRWRERGGEDWHPGYGPAKPPFEVRRRRHEGGA